MHFKLYENTFSRQKCKVFICLCFSSRMCAMAKVTWNDNGLLEALSSSAVGHMSGSSQDLILCSHTPFWFWDSGASGDTFKQCSGPYVRLLSGPHSLSTHVYRFWDSSDATSMSDASGGIFNKRSGQYIFSSGQTLPFFPVLGKMTHMSGSPQDLCPHSTILVFRLPSLLMSILMMQQECPDTFGCTFNQCLAQLKPMLMIQQNA